ncbi:putative lipoprotein [Myxococcus hansupus]|uniref:Putative lipoprotein n=1 Tax=Pseudomyxococcus hansupus TaxID=1297742 RepID=A0A0H4XPF1_9BACT|nr:putative lipoprotein [Myxococcus hansupus]
MIPELGEWVDPGAFEACPAQTSHAACIAPETLVMPADCDGGSLSGLERQGAIYRAELRYESQMAPDRVQAFPGNGGFQFDAAGQPVSVMGNGAHSTSVTDGRFIISSRAPASYGVHERYTFIGCHAQGSRSLTGCVHWCRGGTLRYSGSFRAERMTWREGEPESANLQLLSESFVNMDTPADVYVTHGHAYVVSINRRRLHGGLVVFDVSNPAMPVQRAVVRFPNDEYWNGVWAKDNALYVASGDSGVLVFDLSNPAQPAFIRSHPGNGRIDVHTVFVEGNRLYAMSPSHKQTLIFDVTEPLEPRLLTNFTYPRSKGYPHDAFAYEGRLYVNHLDDGFLIAGLEGETPELLGQYTYPHIFSHANAVGTFNGRTVAFEGGETMGSHVRVLDVTDPANIVKIGEYKLRGLTSVHNMLLVGTRLYVAYYHEGVRVLDVSNPAQPREIAHYNTFRESDPGRGDKLTEGAIGIRVPGDGRIYVVDTSRGLLIFNEP